MRLLLARASAEGQVDNFLRGGLLFAVVMLVLGTIWLSAEGQTEGAGITAGLGFGLCIFVFLSRFKRFKGLGFEGELWEQEMEKAAELRYALQDLSERVGESIFWHMGEGSRFARKDPNKLLGIIERTTRNLEAAGIEGDKIEEMKRPWHKVIMRDLAHPITKRLSEVVREKLHEVQAEIAALGNPVPGERVADLRALAERQNRMNRYSQELEELIWRDDYSQVPVLLRREIDNLAWLNEDERRYVYEECAEEFHDIDQYARERTVRRPENLKM